MLTLIGIPASSGIYIGYAFLLEENFNNLINYNDLSQKIIVVKHLTPDLIVSIEGVSGIISEMGGILSHSAIIAREFSIPCVVGVLDATKIICNGDYINLNGTTGLIQISHHS
jgi:phosphohistidine swiveling domain-containing protein